MNSKSRFTEGCAPPSYKCVYEPVKYTVDIAAINIPLQRQGSLETMKLLFPGIIPAWPCAPCICPWLTFLVYISTKFDNHTPAKETYGVAKDLPTCLSCLSVRR